MLPKAEYESALQSCLRPTYKNTSACLPSPRPHFSLYHPPHMQGFNPESNSVVPDPGEQALLESGLPMPEAKVSEMLPPGGGEAVLPHYQTFSMLVNSMSRTYRWSFDEALRHSQQNALAIRRDPIVMDALRSRQIPVCQLPWHLESDDDQDEEANQGIKALTTAVKAIPRLQQMLMHLSEGIYYGRYGVQTMMEWDWSTKQKQLRIRDHRPINGDKLIFRWGGEVGILVHAAYTGSWQVTDRGRAHFLTPEEREQVLIHRFEPEDADFFEGELAGGINGVGIRSRIYWLWYLRQQVTSFLMDYLERVGAGGFTVYYYEAGNPQSLEDVQAAAEAQWRNNAILFPRYADGRKGGPGVDNVAVSTAGAALLQALITGYFDDIIRRYILGQSLTSEAEGSGLGGSGVAGLHADTFARIIKYDAVNLQETLTTDLIRVLQKYNCPKVTKKIRWVFEIDKPNAEEVMQAAQVFYDLGGTLDEDEVRGTIGLSKPAPGSSMLAKFQSMDPASMAPGAAPQGVPMLGTPGPEAGMPVPGGNPMQAGGPQGQPMQMGKKGPRVRLARPGKAHPVVLGHAQDYLRGAGLPPHEEELDYRAVDPAKAKEIASWYDKAVHSPRDPKTQESYKALKKETQAQYNHLKEKGVSLQPWDKEGQPYANSQEMQADARKGHLYFYQGGDIPEDHPLAEEAQDGLTYNDLFRAVHDYYGHALYGNEFGPRGEEHAWRTHSRMFSPQAQPAMGAETRGQNSWVNYGPHALKGVKDRPYAEQKAVLLPPHLSQEGTPAQTPPQVKLAHHGQNVHVETPEAREAREAQEKYSRGELGLYEYLKAQPSGFRIKIGDSEYVNSFDRGPMVKKLYPVGASQGSAIGQKSLYSPKMLAHYEKFLRENPDEDTEPIVAWGNETGYSIYDGHHRHAAYKSAGRKAIPVWQAVTPQDMPNPHEHETPVKMSKSVYREMKRRFAHALHL